jgi:hypothetical protein
MPAVLQLEKYTKNHLLEERDGFFVIRADAKIENSDD